VLEKVKAIPGANDASYLGQGLVDVGDGAEGERRQRRVDAGVSERNRLVVEADMLDGHPRRGDAPDGETARHSSRLHGENDVHRRRIVLGLSPDPKPISTTRPSSPSVTAARQLVMPAVLHARSTSRGSTCSR
jgi:hypothetical protein